MKLTLIYKLTVILQDKLKWSIDDELNIYEYKIKKELMRIIIWRRQIERKFQFSSVYIICWQYCLLQCSQSGKLWSADPSKQNYYNTSEVYRRGVETSSIFRCYYYWSARSDIKAVRTSMFTPDLPKKYKITNNRLLCTPNRQNNLYSHNNITPHNCLCIFSSKSSRLYHVSIRYCSIFTIASI